MPGSKAETYRLVSDVVDAWIADPENAVVYREDVDGYLVIRMTQIVRDFTSVWFRIGDRSVEAEAYVLPAPPDEGAAVFRQCLVRNRRSWRCHFMVGNDGGLVLHGRLTNETVTPDELSLLLAEIYETIEVSFRPLIKAGWDREK